VLPTETVHGLAALPSVPGATDKLYALKDRPPDVAIAVLVADVEQAETVAVLDARGLRLVDALWPGPLTLVVNRVPGALLDLGGSEGTVGVRCPAHEFVRALAEAVGPIATTSANRHGDPTPATAIEAAASLAGDVDLVIDGGPCVGSPSTVVDLTGPEARILREGPIAAETIVTLLSG
jgi:L-threonylcarbamoyladenylate synthase